MVPPASETLADSWGTGGGRGSGGRSEFNRGSKEKLWEREREVLGRKKCLTLRGKLCVPS